MVLGGVMMIQKFAGFIGVAMVITALVLPGRSTQETTVLRALTGLSSGVIKTAEGR